LLWRKKESRLLAARLVKEVGSEGIFVKTDVANEDDVRSLVEKSVKIYGKLDYAFNNAGIEETMTPLIDQTSEVFDQIMNVNVKDSGDD
jgi:NAD(P)-dependent dehydrogenase (short-subunit alcohol dehydrogenase family)